MVIACERDAQRETIEERGSSLSPRMSPSRAPFFLAPITSKLLLRRCARWTTQYTPKTLTTLIDTQIISQDDLSGFVHLK